MHIYAFQPYYDVTKPFYDTSDVVYVNKNGMRITNLTDTLQYGFIKYIRKSFIIEGDFPQDSANIDKIVFNFLDTLNGMKQIIKNANFCRITFFKNDFDLFDRFYTQRNPYSDHSYVDRVEYRAAYLAWENGRLVNLDYYKDGEIIAWQAYEYTDRFHFFDNSSTMKKNKK